MNDRLKLSVLLEQDEDGYQRPMLADFRRFAVPNAGSSTEGFGCEIAVVALESLP